MNDLWLSLEATPRRNTVKTRDRRERRYSPGRVLLCLFTFCVLGLTGCTGCGQHPEPSTPIASPTQTPDGQQHDDRGHPAAEQLSITKSAAPADTDTFCNSIVFPETPPHRPHGHYVLKESPFPMRDVIRNNPHLFRVDENGDWYPIYGEKVRRLEQLQLDGSSMPVAVYDKKTAEILAEGLEPLPAALFVLAIGGLQQEAKRLLDIAREANPDDFDTLSYWCGMNKDDKPVEVEAVRRRLLEMRPESVGALFGLATHLVDHHPEPREAIPYLEKVYHLNPRWPGAIYVLGCAYFTLGDYEKALRYFQASERFTGPTDGTSLYIPVIKRELAKKRAH